MNTSPSMARNRLYPRLFSLSFVSLSVLNRFSSLLRPLSRSAAFFFARESLMVTTIRLEAVSGMLELCPLLRPREATLSLNCSLCERILAPRMYSYPSFSRSRMFSLLSNPASATTMGFGNSNRFCNFLIMGIIVCPS